MKDIVSKDRGAYFGKRNMIAESLLLSTLLAGGFILDYFKHTKLFIGFCILFGFAFIARSVSAYLLSRHYEPELKLEKGYYFSFKQFLLKIPKSNFGKFCLLVSLIMLATAIASPFFSVYMLKELQFSYTLWTVIIIASSLSTILFMPVWGKFADKYENVKVLRITGMFIPLASLLWLLAPFLIKINFTLLVVYLFVVESISECIWAGFNLSAINFIFDAVTRQRVQLCIAYFNIMNGIGIFIGATLGGIISSMDFSFGWLTPLLFVFLLSGILRFLVYLAVISKIKEIKNVEKIS